MEWSVPKLWDGSDVFIIGGGPSIGKLDLEPIHNKRVIGVNCAFTLGHWVDICFFGDARWWDWHRDELLTYPCLKVTNAERLVLDGNLFVLKRLPQGLSKKPKLLAWNGNSGIAAINLAYLLGANRIFLLGFDMKVEGENHNWHDDHEHTPPGDIYINKFIPQFKRFKKELDKIGVCVYNLNSDSDLKIFPFLKFEDALKKEAA